MWRSYTHANTHFYTIQSVFDFFLLFSFVSAAVWILLRRHSWRVFEHPRYLWSVWWWDLFLLYTTFFTFQPDITQILLLRAYQVHPVSNCERQGKAAEHQKLFDNQECQVQVHGLSLSSTMYDPINIYIYIYDDYIYIHLIYIYIYLIICICFVARMAISGSFFGPKIWCRLRFQHPLKTRNINDFKLDIWVQFVVNFHCRNYVWNGEVRN